MNFKFYLLFKFFVKFILYILWDMKLKESKILLTQKTIIKQNKTFFLRAFYFQKFYHFKWKI